MEQFGEILTCACAWVGCSIISPTASVAFLGGPRHCKDYIVLRGHKSRIANHVYIYRSIREHIFTFTQFLNFITTMK